MRDLKELEDEIRKIRRESEIYIVSPRDVEYYLKCLHLQKEVSKLLDKIEVSFAGAMEALKYLQPFARKRVTVKLRQERSYSEILVVGHSIYTARVWYDEEYNGRKTVSPEEMFDTILKHKDKIVPLLRKSIRSDFLEIVESVKEIWEALKMEISRNGPFRIWWRGDSGIKARYVNKICMRAEGRFYAVYYTLEDGSPNYDYLYELEKFFEVYEVIYDILREAHQRLTEKFKKGEEELKRIKEIVAPYALAKKL